MWNIFDTKIQHCICYLLQIFITFSLRAVRCSNDTRIILEVAGLFTLQYGNLPKAISKTEIPRLHTSERMLYSTPKTRSGCKMKWNEMKWNEMKWNEMKWNEMKWNEMKWNEMKWNEMKWNEMKWNEMKWNEMKWNEMKAKSAKRKAQSAKRKT